MAIKVKYKYTCIHCMQAHHPKVYSQMLSTINFHCLILFANCHENQHVARRSRERNQAALLAFLYSHVSVLTTYNYTKESQT